MRVAVAAGLWSIPRSCPCRPLPAVHARQGRPCPLPSRPLPLPLLVQASASTAPPSPPPGLMGLPTQLFAANPLDRSAGNKKATDFLPETLGDPRCRVLLIAGRKVAVHRGAGGETSLAWVTLDQLETLGVRVGAEGVEWRGGRMVPTAAQGEAADLLAPLLLGEAAGGGFRFALDVGAGPAAPDAVAELGAELSELRPLMLTLPGPEAAIAGQASALAHWHASARFCGSCGSPTGAIEAGMKRQCSSADCGRRVYPRTDPVAIMIAESPCGERCLLGRVKKFRAGAYTALAGFVEQGESLEEAVARELHEESGVPVTSIRVVGSQPWPPGRGGTCELMLGCLAKATCDDIVINTDEMEDVRWFSRQEVLAAVARSPNGDNPFKQPMLRPGEKEGELLDPGANFWIPGPYAIAHWLIKGWAEGTLDHTGGGAAKL